MTNALLMTALVIPTEVVFFVQMKAQVKLFIASNVVNAQEHQIVNMLDTVPDKVLVCTKESNVEQNFAFKTKYNSKCAISGDNL